MSPRVRSNRVCFTINNYELETVDTIERWFNTDERIRFACAGLEIGENGTPHIQGFVHMDVDPKGAGIKFWKAIIPEGERAHLENARGDDESNKKYCAKEGPFIEVGEPKESLGCLWARVYDATLLGLPEALAIDKEMSIKYVNQIEKLVSINHVPKMSVNLNLRDWQQKVLEKLAVQTDRKILFVVDEKGGKGKSMLTKHMMTTMDAWCCTGRGSIAILT